MRWPGRSTEVVAGSLTLMGTRTCPGGMFAGADSSSAVVVTGVPASREDAEVVPTTCAGSVTAFSGISCGGKTRVVTRRAVMTVPGSMRVCATTMRSPWERGRSTITSVTVASPAHTAASSRRCVCVSRRGGAFGLFFSVEPVRRFNHVFIHQV